MASLRSRSKEHTSDTKPQSTSPPPSSSQLIPLRLFNLPSLPVLAALLLLLTITLGTFNSFSLYSRDEPTIPIHQLTRIPTSSLTSTHNHHPSIPSSSTLPYFAKKSNFFNQTFVKLGWAWTSLAIWAHLILYATHHQTHPSHESENSVDRSQQPTRHLTPTEDSRHVTRSITLYCTSTALWIFLTQWFFGSSLIDRLLVLTGAECVPSMIHTNDQSEKLKATTSKLANAYCERRWGQRLPGLDAFTIATHKPYWRGGMDISGHTFLLSFSILLILSTLTPSLRKAYLTRTMPTSYRLGVYANLVLVGIWWWMLLMTSLYFHGPVEKAAGLVVGVGAWCTSEWLVNRMMG